MSKYCINCGKEIKDGETLCENCKGTNEEKITNTTSTQPTNGLAIAGFVLVMLGFSIVGLILSIIGLNDCKKKNANLKGLALAGIIIGIVRIVLTIIIIFIWIIIIAASPTNTLNSNSTSSYPYNNYHSSYYNNYK